MRAGTCPQRRLVTSSRWRWLIVPASSLLYYPVVLALFHLAGTVAFGLGLFAGTVVAGLTGAAPGLVTAVCLQGLNLLVWWFNGAPTPHPVSSIIIALLANAILIFVVDRFRALLRWVTHLNQQLDREVQARLASEVTLERNLQLHQSLLATLGEGVGLFDAADRFLFANAATERLFGAEPGSLIGCQITEFLSPEAQAVLPRWKGAGGNDTVGFELQLAGKEARTVLVTQTSMQADEAGEIHYLRVMRDITERAQMERERREFDQYLQRTEALHSLAVRAGGVVHDLNNLLSGVIGNVDLARMRLVRSPDAARDCLQEARKFAIEAVNLSRKMLANVTERAGSLETVDLAREVGESLRLVESNLLARANLNNEIPTELPLILAERIGIHQVVTNLVVNAIEAMESSHVANLTLSARAITVSENQPRLRAGVRVPSRGEYVALSVTDSGVGMSEEAMDHLFEPFYTTKVHGRGMGLIASLEIVKAHRGGLFVESRSGVGTTFHVYWPVALPADGVEAIQKCGGTEERNAAASGIEQDSTEPGAKRSGIVQRPNRTVMLVDDEAHIRQTTGHLLEELGCRVILADCAAEALSLYRQSHREIRFVLLDVNMPDQSGIEVLGQLRGIDPKTRVVLTSGSCDHRSVSLFRDRDGVEFLPKPHGIDGLRQLLAEAGKASGVGV
jgi:PAS domain S-box-containing protein